MALSPGRLVNAAAAIARRDDRRIVARDIVGRFVFEGERRLKTQYLSALMPETVDVIAQVSMNVQHDWELPYAERCVLDALIRARTPAVMFEFGTFTGTTTCLMAAAAPSATVHTIDLDTAGLRQRGIKDEVGRTFIGSELATRIVQYRGNTADYDLTGMFGRVDLVFVDAGHEYHDVVTDSQNAIRMLSPNGVIVWDDYHPRHPGVVRALNELGKHHRIVSIARTRLAIRLPDLAMPDTL